MTEGRKLRSRWRKAKRATGLAAVGEAGKPDSYEYWQGDIHLLTVSPCLNRHRDVTGWFWYTMQGKAANSLTITGEVATAEEAKAQAIEFWEKRDDRG